MFHVFIARRLSIEFNWMYVSKVVIIVVIVKFAIKPTKFYINYSKI